MNTKQKIIEEINKDNINSILDKYGFELIQFIIKNKFKIPVYKNEIYEWIEEFNSKD